MLYCLPLYDLSIGNVSNVLSSFKIEFRETIWDKMKQRRYWLPFTIVVVVLAIVLILAITLGVTLNHDDDDDGGNNSSPQLWESLSTDNIMVHLNMLEDVASTRKINFLYGFVYDIYFCFFIFYCFFLFVDLFIYVLFI